jgi:hypothetical protein
MAIKDIFHTGGGDKSILFFGARGSVGRVALSDLCNFFGEVYLVSSPYSKVSELYNALRNVIVELVQSSVVVSPQSAYGKFLAAAGELALLDKIFVSSISEIETVMEEVFSFCAKKMIKTFNVVRDVSGPFNNIDCVFSATSEGKAFLNKNNFTNDCIIFDVARPFDFIRDESGENIIEGGLVRLPDSRVNLSDSNIIGCDPGINLACLSETIALSMENVDQSYSLGREIQYEHAKQVLSIAQKHGFNHFVSRSKIPA